MNALEKSFGAQIRKMAQVYFFGDSITQGFWDTEGGWVERLRKHYDGLALKDLKHNKQPEIFNLGVSGDTTRNLLARIEAETKIRKWPGDPQIAVVAIGTNDDLFQNGKQWVEPPEFRANIQKIIDVLKPLVEGILFVGNVAVDEKLTTPVFWDNIHYTNDELKKYEDIIREVTKAQNISFVPVFDKFKAEQAKRNLLADGLHPNDSGHKLIASLVQPELEKLLN